MVQSTTLKIEQMRTNAVSSCGLDISFGAIAPALAPEVGCFPELVGVLSLSVSIGFEGVEGTFRGKALEDISR